ncbi:MAG: signal recognition particle-docking protein FtsY [Pelagibacterales bacterium]|nr:signal recognition particle-docking protein FtsY [Pelagibacterales bacterium]
MGIFEKFKIGLNKSASSFSDGMKNLVIKKKIDEETLNKIEEFLIMSDVGVDVASEIRKIISEKKILPNQDSIIQVNQILLNYIEKLMNPLEKEILNNENVGTKVFLIAGVNGVGKTTTIGKLGKILKKNNKKIIFAATDTFRAAAIEQLENWSKKIDVKIIKSETGSDPASVAFKALEFAIKNNFDYVLIDTAGRLQNKKNLMEEYKKISNVTKKIDPNSPHEVLLVLDATTGQNALIQIEEFQKITPITGIIMTKLDGTAKGGILIALAKKFNLPIIALGLGEKEDDLQIFNSKDFAKALININ